MCSLTYLPGRGHKESRQNMTDERRTRQSRDRIDCFVAPAIILRPKAARDKGGRSCSIGMRIVAKSVRKTHVTISLCSIRARACVSRCIIYRSANTLNEIKIDSNKTDSFFRFRAVETPRDARQVVRARD